MIARAVSLYGTGVSAGSSLNTDPLNGLKIVIVDHLPLSAAFIASCTGKTLTRERDDKEGKVDVKWRCNQS